MSELHLKKVVFGDNSYQQTAADRSFRNKVINGDMWIDQEFSGVAQTPTGSKYIMDQWALGATQASKLTVQQVADAPVGFKYSAKITVASQFSAGATDIFAFQQFIEGVHIVDLQLGVSDSIQLTLSNYIKGSVPGVYSCFLTNPTGTRSYIGTILVTTDWSRVQITLPNCPDGVWPTDTSLGLLLGIDLGSGANYSTSNIGVWQTGNLRRMTGSVQFVNQPVGSTLNITGVQLEKAGAASEFEHVPYDEQLRRCQRYFEACDFYKRFDSILGTSSVTHTYFYHYRELKRVIPALVLGTLDSSNASGMILGTPKSTGHSYVWQWVTDGVVVRYVQAVSYANARL